MATAISPINNGYLPKPVHQSLRLKFAGRDEARKALAEMAKYQRRATAGTVFVVGAGINVGLTAALPAHFGLAHAILGYMKLAKAVNAHHTELQFYGHRFAKQLFEIYEPENPDHPRWKAQLAEMKGPLGERLMRPWERAIVTGEYSEAGLAKAEMVSKTSSDFLNSLVELPQQVPVAEELLKGIPYIEIAEKLAERNEVVEAVTQAVQLDNPIIAGIEYHLHHVLELMGVTDNSIPIIGMMITAMKSAGLLAAGEKTEETLNEDIYNSSTTFLEDKVARLENKYSFTFQNITDHCETTSDFLKGYASKPEDYNPLKLVSTTFNNLLELLDRTLSLEDESK